MAAPAANGTVDNAVDNTADSAAILVPGAENDLEAAMIITDLKRICPRCKGGGHQPGFSALG
ncbi:MAG: hypothetical protein V3S64_06430, partial [bacterium]